MAITKNKQSKEKIEQMAAAAFLLKKVAEICELTEEMRRIYRYDVFFVSYHDD